ncbi:hypothetical protein [Vibrio vulnificus]|uniref:hypothetical protein n=1 Tax=Vibrio vulnificus TaxID=672 RepID=UPI0010296D7E|nr:hypothetical protein [Vibrio vulnificus]RZQ33480.1 hypothetical protein D8T42_03570 [Vibrio vulnificus]RZQ83600.1 hypothetical protein D8T31_03575 [Vibrio vulnificus]
MSSNVLLITLNSIYELTGGGIYARTILDSLISSKGSNEVFVVHKESNPIFLYECNIFGMPKTLSSDLISRLFLSPTFIFFYVFKIIKLIRNENIEIVFLHSSRLGVMSLFLRLFTNVKIITCFDNNELKLCVESIMISRKVYKKIWMYFELVLIYLSEKLICKMSNNASFITKYDRQQYCLDNFKKTRVLPVSLPLSDLIISEKKYHFLFTGSFSFEPNIEALFRYKELAGNNPQFNFLVAGRFLNKLNLETLPENLFLVSDPSFEHMQKLFSQSENYISPVSHGSGMKTKLAEALSQDMKVYCSRHSAVGYDDVLEESKSNIYVYNDFLKDFDVWLEVLKNKTNEISPRAQFIKYYTTQRTSAVLEDLMN